MLIVKNVLKVSFSDEYLQFSMNHNHIPAYATLIGKEHSSKERKKYINITKNRNSIYLKIVFI